MNQFSLLANERVASIREIQENPSRALRGITRITRSAKTIGFFLSNQDFADLVEDYEALHSPAFVQRVARGRRALKSGKGSSLASVARKYGV